MGMAVPVYYSANMVRKLPDDGKRYETVHGELLVTPAPRALHQRIVLRLARVLADYVESGALGELTISPADISWSPDTLVACVPIQEGDEVIDFIENLAIQVFRPRFNIKDR